MALPHFKQVRGKARVAQLDISEALATTDPASRQYVLDQVAGSVYGLDPKNSVRVASTVNVSLASPGTTIDGVTLSTGNRILLKNQTTASQNGIYDYNGSGTALTRSIDANSSAKVTSQLSVSVSEGTANANTTWKIITPDPITLDSTAISFDVFSNSYYATPTLQNKDMAAVVTLNTGDVICNTGIAAAPAKSSFVDVQINSIGVSVGDGVKTAQAYFSGDTGTTARARNAIAVGDKLYKGSALGYDTDTADTVSFNFVV